MVVTAFQNKANERRVYPKSMLTQLNDIPFHVQIRKKTQVIYTSIKRAKWKEEKKKQNSVKMKISN